MNVGPAAGETRDVFTVSRLNAEVRDLLSAHYPLIWVEGELSNVARPASGHLYFTLKDARAQVRCALFRNRSRGLGFVPEDGMQVLVRASRRSASGWRGNDVTSTIWHGGWPSSIPASACCSGRSAWTNSNRGWGAPCRAASVPAAHGWTP